MLLVLTTEEERDLGGEACGVDRPELAGDEPRELDFVNGAPEREHHKMAKISGGYFLLHAV